jgi:hypothetical protein
MDDLEDCLQQVYRMALAAMQSHTFWLHTSPDNNPHEETFKKFGHFFYATNEAHLTMMFISLDALYDEKERLLNFRRLLTLAKPKLTPEQYEPLERKLDKLRTLAKGIGIIRNNSFAHIADHATRMKQGERYALNRGDYLRLCYHSLEVATQIGRLLGATLTDVTAMTDKDLEHIQALYSELERNA